MLMAPSDRDLHPMRQNFIIAKALQVAADHLDTWSDTLRPDSDIADMRLLIETEFSDYKPMVQYPLPIGPGADRWQKLTQNGRE